VAKGVGFSFLGGGDPKKQLLDYLRNKKLLLLLDSFEMVVDRAGFVAELLGASPGVKVLVTSRVRLNLSGEQVFPLGGVDVPPSGADGNAQNYGSVKLFLAAARRVSPNYNPDHLGGIVRICRLVDGLPLSLLLASNWISEFSADEIADRIEQSLDFLATEWADLPERQRSLRATFEYSWNMLSEAEQSAMMKCAVFRNPFSIQAAHQVAGCSDRTLHALLGKNTLFSPSAGHYQMHDMIRQYSMEKLATCPEAQAAMIHQRHSDYFLEWASAWAKIFKSAGQKKMLENADSVFDDVRTAWDWAIQQAEIPKLWRASEGLFLYYFLRYRFREGENACKTTIDRIMMAPPSPERMRLEGWILVWQACFQ
jgi:predicted ATPase